MVHHEPVQTRAGVTIGRAALVLIGLALIVLGAVTATSEWGDSGRGVSVGYGLIEAFLGICALVGAMPTAYRQRVARGLFLAYAGVAVIGFAWVVTESDGDPNGPAPVVSPGGSHGVRVSVPPSE